MPQIKLSAGVVEYDDTGGDGPVVVALHGVLMNSALWRDVVDRLRGECRCVVPTLPIGGHRHAMVDDADMSPVGVAELIVEFLDRLELRDVTLVGVDTGGALAQLLIARHPDRVARLGLVACDAFENFPPGLPGKVAVLSARMPGGINAALQPLRWRPLRRLPFTFGWMSQKPVPHDVMDSWLEPCQTNRAIRKDAARFLRAVDRRDLLAAARSFGSFHRPVLVVWAHDDRVMPADHGLRLAGMFPDSRLETVDNSGTLIPVDQPVVLAELIHDFIKQ
ncbi:alpha/beta fold hydrolase [Phytoactinopolyspora endophytica]|uniref:alpha/beta fold hydrolase n=1 Tax=Phytoactinopolyspora endophytica TaxID=1642495 RepID=UPI00101D8155|nr:alpha/beta hydrolase [Phytoactinopolyspora endophytica]